MPDRNGYSRTQITLHWLIALLIFATWFTHEVMDDALEHRIETGATGIDGNPVHVWLGGLAFALILVRIIVRHVSGAPGVLPETSPLMKLAAIWGHRLLYLLMVVVPALGALTWYGGIEATGEPHETLANLLMVVALGHAGAAIWHKYVLKDDTMQRMLKPRD